MTVDLAEEHSTASLATDRLEVEVADRIRLEKELQDVQVSIDLVLLISAAIAFCRDADTSLGLPQGQNKRLQQATERLELELLHARTADLNG